MCLTVIGAGPAVDLSGLDGLEMRGLGKLNVILGKNGCGKSHILKAADAALRSRPEIGSVRYITPERAGLLI
jgi:predicted ATP-binding protein involved in virulence